MKCRRTMGRCLVLTQTFTFLILNALDIIGVVLFTLKIYPAWIVFQTTSLLFIKTARRQHITLNSQTSVKLYSFKILPSLSTLKSVT